MVLFICYPAMSFALCSFHDPEHHSPLLQNQRTGVYKSSQTKPRPVTFKGLGSQSQVKPNQGQLGTFKSKFKTGMKLALETSWQNWQYQLSQQLVMNKWMMLETLTSLDCKRGGRKKETETWGVISSRLVWLICKLCMANKLLDVSLFYLHHNILAMLLYYHQYMNVNLPLCIDIVVDICKAWGVGIYLWCVDKDVMLMLKDWIYFTIYNTLW